MYGDGANVMRLVYSRHNDLVIRPGERSRDFVQYPPGTTPPTPTPTHGAAAPGAAGGQQGGQPAPAQQYAQQYVPRQGAPRQGGAAPQQGYGRPGGHPATQQQQQQYQARPGGYPGYPPPGSWGGAMAPQPYAAYGGYYHPQQYQGYPPPRPPHHQVDQGGGPNAPWGAVRWTPCTTLATLRDPLPLPKPPQGYYQQP